MTTYVWSTTSVSQSLTFTAADTMAFDSPGGAATVAVAFGGTVANIT